MGQAKFITGATGKGILYGGLFDANTILKADTDNTPEALTIDEQRLVGRITGGEITGLTAAQVRTLLAIAGADTIFHHGYVDGAEIGGILDAMDHLDEALDGGTF